MIQKIWKELVFILLAGVGIWFGFSQFTCSDLTPMKVPQEKQKLLGEKIYDELKKTRKSVTSPEVRAAVDNIKFRLMKSLEKKDRANKKDKSNTYQIYILDDPMVNAFALPGGIIVIFSGLVQFCDTPEELAGVIAHEMGHVENEHVIQKIYTRFGITLMSRLFTGNDPTIATEMGEMITENYFSRQMEEEADSFALDLLERSSIQPRVLATFFKKISKNEINIMNIKALSTHPDSNERYQNVLLYEVKKDFQEKKISLDWQKVRNSCHDSR